MCVFLECFRSRDRLVFPASYGFFDPDSAEQHQAHMVGYRLNGRPAGLVPFDRPVKGAHQQHAYEAEIDVAAQCARFLRLGENAPPEFGIGVALPDVMLLHLFGDLSENADIGGCVIVMLQKCGEMRLDGDANSVAVR